MSEYRLKQVLAVARAAVEAAARRGDPAARPVAVGERAGEVVGVVALPRMSADHAALCAGVLRQVLRADAVTFAWEGAVVLGRGADGAPEPAPPGWGGPWPLTARALNVHAATAAGRHSDACVLYDRTAAGVVWHDDLVGLGGDAGNARSGLEPAARDGIRKELEAAPADGVELLPPRVAAEVARAAFLILGQEMIGP